MPDKRQRGVPLKLTEIQFALKRGDGRPTLGVVGDRAAVRKYRHDAVVRIGDGDDDKPVTREILELRGVLFLHHPASWREDEHRTGAQHTREQSTISSRLAGGEG